MMYIEVIMPYIKGMTYIEGQVRYIKAVTDIEGQNNLCQSNDTIRVFLNLI